jgi:hypothetical protein
MEKAGRVVEIKRDDELQPGNLGLSMSESKSLLSAVQATMVTA